MSRLASSRNFLILALLLAAFLRFWQLSEMPPSLYHDEAYNGLDALSLLQGKTFPQFYEGWELYAQDAHADNPPRLARWPLFFEGNYGREPLHIYLMALSIWLLGATPLAIRAVPAAAGVLAVWTTYLAAKGIFRDEKRELAEAVPILAAFALAILFPAVHFSRFGLRVMLFVPVETLAVYFFWRGIHGAEVQRGRSERVRGEIFWFILAGVMLGAGLYVYAAARLFPLLFAGFVTFWFWRDRAALRRFWRPVAVMAGASLLTAVPILLFFAQYPYFFVFRIAYVANKGLGTIEGRPWLTWLFNIGRTVRGLFWLGETHLRHNLPGRPYLDPVQAVLFVIGVAASLRQKRQLRTVFLLLWLVVMLLPTIMSGDAPHFGRMIGAAPVIAILVGSGIYHASRITFHKLRISEYRLRFTFYVLLLAISLFFTSRDYFGRYAAHPQLAADFYLPDWNLGQYAAAQSPETSLFLTPTQEEMATIYFALEGDTEHIRSFAGTGALVPTGPVGAGTLYLIRPSAIHRLDAIVNIFPEVVVGEEKDNFIPATVKAGSAQLQPDHRAAHTWSEKISLLGWSGDEEDGVLAITFYWRADKVIERNYTAFVHLLDDAGELAAQADRQPDGYPTSDWRPGEIIVDRYLLNLPEGVNSGAYKLQTGWYYLPTLERLGDPFGLSP